LKKAIVDTSAILYSNYFGDFDIFLTVPEVVEEVKDKFSTLKLLTIHLQLKEPSEESLEKVVEAARITGDIEKLSKTDLKLIALALEERGTLISSDKSVQNVASLFGIKILSVFTGKITYFIVWKKFCPTCKRFVEEKFKECPTCGGKLKLIPYRKKPLKV